MMRIMGGDSKGRLLVIELFTAEILYILRAPLADDDCGLGRVVVPVVAAITFVYVRLS
jgi:hypothetical protein